MPLPPDGRERDADYTVVVEDEPRKPEKPLTRIEQNLWTAAKTPGKWVRIAAYTSEGAAHTLASTLRHNKRATNRPVGSWEFNSGAIVDEGSICSECQREYKDQIGRPCPRKDCEGTLRPKRYGVRAKFLPPEGKS